MVVKSSITLYTFHRNKLIVFICSGYNRQCFSFSIFLNNLCCLLELTDTFSHLNVDGMDELKEMNIKLLYLPHITNFYSSIAVQ